jgi:hypothetical protein
MVELESMPCLRSLSLPSSCAERAVDAEAVYAITTLTTLRFNGWGVNEWVLDLSRLTTLTTLRLPSCRVKDKQVLELSHLTGLTDLNLINCRNVAAEGLRAVSSLTALITLDLSLPARCAADAAYAELLCGLPTLITLHFYDLREVDEDGDPSAVATARRTRCCRH